MKLKLVSVAAASLLSLVSFGSQAAVTDFASHGALETSGLVFTAPSFFEDVYTFTLASSAVITSSVSEFGVTGGSFGTLKTYALRSYGADNLIGTADDAGFSWVYGGLTGAAHSVTLAAGQYYYDVIGFGSSPVSLYTLSSSLAPVTTVPEPETYALMLAGLGTLGFLARRRRRG